MLDDPQTEHQVKGIWQDGQVQYIRLTHKVPGPMRAIRVVCFHCIGQITGKNPPTGPQKNFRESTCATAYFQNTPAVHPFQILPQAPPETVTRNGGSRMGIKLRLLKPFPLQPESI